MELRVARMEKRYSSLKLLVETVQAWSSEHGSDQHLQLGNRISNQATNTVSSAAKDCLQLLHPMVLHYYAD
jgi:hypothetical protein